jgi:hypothetical protein
MSIPSSCNFLKSKIGKKKNYLKIINLYLYKILSKYDGTAGEDDIENSSVYPSTGRTVREETIPTHSYKVK